MKVLLHLCCGPCLIYPFRKLRDQGLEVSGFFYNPNIHPISEYNKRKDAVELIAKDSGISVFYEEYNPAEFFQAVNEKEEFPARCSICWALRLKRTAEEAKDKGFDAFTTTLLVSPYQNQELLKSLGEKISRDSGVKFYYEDFRPGFRQAHDEAKTKGIYCQKYCGCLYSEIERCRKSPKA